MKNDLKGLDLVILLADEIKLRRSGELFYQCSLSILARGRTILEDARRRELDLSDTNGVVHNQNQYCWDKPYYLIKLGGVGSVGSLGGDNF